MLIRDILISESYADDLVLAVQDLLSRIMARDIKKISTERFQTMLAKEGYVTSIEELIQAVDASGFASSVNDQEIIPANELSGDVGTDAEQTVDVGDLAGDQAMKDIKADI
jgi:hypothetical protein